jgi:putative Mn2+ efflux pump MntP
MTLVELLLVALSLSLDALAVAIVGAAAGHLKGARPVFRIAFHFGLFQALMPMAGWLLANSVASLLSSVDHWIACVLLSIVGVRMIRASGSGSDDSGKRDPSKGMTLVALSVATSIDAFAVGVSLGCLGTDVIRSSLVIGVITGGVALAGIFAGRKLGQAFGRKMEIIGGMILIAISIRILISHLTA